MSKLTISKLAEELNINSRAITKLFISQNYITEKGKEKRITEKGKEKGGEEKEGKYGYYTIWDKNIIKDNNLQDELDKEIKQIKQDAIKNNSNLAKAMRDKFPAKYKAINGVLVRSKAELIIANLLIYNKIEFNYEPTLPLKEDLWADFYLPKEDIYIEFWGFENKKEYLDRKKIKQNIYKDNNLKLMELDDSHIENLNDLLLQYIKRLEAL